MTMLEFEAWVTDHYDALLSMARDVIRDNPDDILHDMIESYCDGRRALPQIPVESVKVGLFRKVLIGRRINQHEALSAGPEVFSLDHILESLDRVRGNKQPQFEQLYLSDETASVGKTIPPSVVREIEEVFANLPQPTKRLWLERLGTDDSPVTWPVVGQRFGISALQAKNTIAQAKKVILRQLSPSASGWMMKTERALIVRWLGDPQYRGHMMKSSRIALRSVCSRARAISSPPAYRRAG
jgi:hypothetical protein